MGLLKSSGPPMSAGSRGGRFAKHEAGNVAMIFGLCLVPLLGLAGGTLDYIAASAHRATLQSTADAAALAGARAFETGDGGVRKAVADFVKASTDDIVAGAKLRVDIDRKVGRVTVDATADVPTAFMPLFGISKLEIGTTSEVIQSTDALEIALVMDNTGSMGERGKLQAMKRAATELVESLVAASPKDTVHFAVVPFGTFVNVGSDKAGQAWIDNAHPGLSPIHSEIFSKPANRLDLYATLKTAWRGCVEARPAPHDASDTPPTVANPVTLFVPAFAPDEPDQDDYRNDYLKDKKLTLAGRLTGALLELALQSNLDKYVLSGLTQDIRTTAHGPNYACGVQPITALTVDAAKVKAAIAGMTAGGYTNIAEGAIWGLRVLSPEAPFTEGKPWGDKRVRKIIVLLTDGKNELEFRPNANGVAYNAYGYLWNKRLGLDVGATYNQIQAKLNDKTVAGCAHAKEKEVTVYTIRLEEPDLGVKGVLQSCASRAEYFFDAPSASDLSGVFKQIVAEITKLRIAR